jgi:hypothetical protein
VPNDETDWIVIRDAHPALISRRVFDHAKQRRESRPGSVEQRGRDPRLKTHGRAWNGLRSRFILSGLLTCARCGSRYQGVTRNKSNKRSDGSRVTTRYYGCGGHITKGNNICQMNPIPQDHLESAVIDAVLDFYKPFLAKDGRRRLSEAVKQQIGSEGEQFEAARTRAEEERDRIAGIINDLLDNITPTNREFVDGRLQELTNQRRQLETRLEELDRLATSQAEIAAIVADAMKFLSGLEFTLRQGLPQEKLTALRQCIERVRVDRPNGTSQVRIRLVPAANLTGSALVPLAIVPSGAGRKPRSSTSAALQSPESARPAGVPKT